MQAGPAEGWAVLEELRGGTYTPSLFSKCRLFVIDQKQVVERLWEREDPVHFLYFLGMRLCFWYQVPGELPLEGAVAKGRGLR